MSREIKYRAWDKHRNVMRSWGELTVSHGMVYVCDFFDQEDYVFMEYIGRLDHHGKEMCIGDIVRLYDERMPKEHREQIVQVTFENGCFMFGGFYPYGLEGQEVEIIGNIYETPQLLVKVSNE